MAEDTSSSPLRAVDGVRTPGIAAALTRFCRSLHDRGLPVSPAESVDAARALQAVDLGDRAEVYFALRAVLTTAPGDIPIFDELFDQLWATGPRHPVTPIPGPRAPTPRARPPSTTAQTVAAATLARWARVADAGTEEPGTWRLPSALETSGPQVFTTFDDAALPDVRRVARRIARRLATRPSRRWRAASRGVRLDLRRTVRHALRTAGDLSVLLYRKRRIRRTKLVVLCDVSGSMDLYARLLLQFLFALQHSFARVETFVFATRLSRITNHLSGREYRQAVEAVSRDVGDWNGGTRIGTSLGRFATEWRRLTDRRTVVIILSDGWDTDEPAAMTEALTTIRRRAGKVIWLNPLLGSPEYQPLTRGMQAALPHLDVFAPAHNLESLDALAQHLLL